MVNDRKVLDDLLVSLSVQSFDGKVKDVIQMLSNYQDKYIAEGYFDILISVDHYYEDVDVSLRGSRYENDQEYERRIDMEKIFAQRQKADKLKREEDERKLYLRLKKKYEGE